MYSEYDTPTLTIKKFISYKNYFLGDLVYHNNTIYVCKYDIMGMYNPRPFSYNNWEEYIMMPSSNDTNLDTQSLIDELNVHYE